MAETEEDRAKFEQARRRLARHIASVLAHAMSETDTDFATIDMRRGVKFGHSQDQMLELLDGFGGMVLSELSDFALAMGVYLNVHLMVGDRLFGPTGEVVSPHG